MLNDKEIDKRKNISSKVIILLTLAFSFLFTSCGKESGNQSNSASGESGIPKSKLIYGVASDSIANEISRDDEGRLIFENEGDAIEDDSLVYKVAIPSTSPFKGLFNELYGTSVDDAAILSYTKYGYPIDSQNRIKKGGPIDIDFDRENKKITYKIVKELKWNDGTPVTARDIQFAYEIVGHGKYTGHRYDEGFKNIVGIKEYHYGTSDEKGKADFEKENPELQLSGATSISGVKIIDNQTLEVSFLESTPDILWGSGTILPQPYEYLKDISIDKLESNDKARTKPLSFGPYYIDNVVDGQTALLKANKYFYLGEPKLKNIELKILNPDLIPISMQNGEFDDYSGGLSAYYDDIKNLDNYTFVKYPNNSLSYLGFKLGKQISGEKEFVPNPNSKSANVNLRKAMELAIDIEGVCQEYYSGLKIRGNTFLPISFPKLLSKDLKPVKYDPEGAKKLLDEAGYKDIDGDGFREDPKGEKLELILANAKGTQKSEDIIQLFLNQWKEVGIDVKLKDGQSMDFNKLVDVIQENEACDIFTIGFSLGSNPNPRDMWGPNSFFNICRWTNKEFTSLINELESDAGFDNQKRLEIFDKLQHVFYREKPAVILYNSYDISAINKRVKHYEYSLPNDEEKPFWDTYLIELTAKEPLKATTSLN